MKSRIGCCELAIRRAEVVESGVGTAALVSVISAVLLLILCAEE